ncbi:MAG: MBL fold metallo-hydrolase [Nanoarchaeota archaeon]
MSILEYKWLGHAALKLIGEKIVYIDPFQIQKNFSDADIILCTHDHYDHCSIDDIKKVMNEKTTIVCPPDCLSKFKGLPVKEVIPVEPCQEITVKGVSVETIPAYNVNKFRSPGMLFHPKDNYWVGYIVTLGGLRIYHSGDTDKISEMSLLHDIDVAFMAVGGTYTMTWHEAVEAVLQFHPKKAIPIHYGSIVGSVSDAINFKNEVIKHKIKSDVMSTF